MSEIDRLETKIKVADYAEQNGMVLLKDYGNWIAIGFPPEVSAKEPIRLGKPNKKKKGADVTERDAKRMIENNIKGAVTEREVVRA